MPQEGLTVLARIRTSLPVHPTLHHADGSPVQALGVSRSGKLIWPVRGGAPDGDGGGDGSGGASGSGEGAGSGGDGSGSAGGQGAGDAGGQAGQQQGGTGQQAAQQGSGDNLPDDPAALKTMIAELRRENASDRTGAKQTAAEEARAEMAQQIGKALGLIKDDEPADPAKLTEQLTATQAQARQAAVELAVFRAAGSYQGDPNALLDSRAFLTKVADLDPTAADFAAKVDAAIKDAVTSNPKLKTVQAAGASGADHAGGSGEQRNTGKPLPLAQAVSAHYGT
jgi:hypothetical protein